MLIIFFPNFSKNLLGKKKFQIFGQENMEICQIKISGWEYVT
jgi:hypothetical protein